MVKPKKPRREMAMLTIWDILSKDGAETFSKESFIENFKRLEKEENQTFPVSFPLGTVSGDVDTLIQYLLDIKVLLEVSPGMYKCTMV